MIYVIRLWKGNVSKECRYSTLAAAHAALSFFEECRREDPTFYDRITLVREVH